MPKAERNLAKLKDPLDISLAADADLNTKWSRAGSRYKNPARKITVAEALVAASRPREPEDAQSQSPITQSPN